AVVSGRERKIISHKPKLSKYSEAPNPNQSTIFSEGSETRRAESATCGRKFFRMASAQTLLTTYPANKVHFTVAVMRLRLVPPDRRTHSARGAVRVTRSRCKN